jgi:hypothetical protein
MRLARIALPLTLTLLPGAVLAEGQGPFLAETGRWTIESVFSTCVAINQPAIELELSAAHVLGLSRVNSGEITLTVAFWPGIISEADKSISLTLGENITFLDAVPDGAEGLVRTVPLPAELLAALANVGADTPLLVVSAPATGAIMGFATRDIPAVLQDLERCAATLSPG